MEQAPTDYGMRLYKKLVRDGIPDMMMRSGTRVMIRTANEKEIDGFLKDKFYEEIEDFFRAPGMEELADILELVHTAASVHSFDLAKVEEMRQQKAVAKGSFSRRLILVGAK